MRLLALRLNVATANGHIAALMHGCVIRVLGQHHRLVYLLQTSAHIDNAVIHIASELAQVRQ
jgi:hypothetical protein